jgi:hypothetical protein
MSKGDEDSPSTGPTTSPSKPGPARQVPCPSCRGPALFAPGNPWRPFCSERCRGTDLSAWATEQFRVAGPVADEGDQSETPPAAH